MFGDVQDYSSNLVVLPLELSAASSAEEILRGTRVEGDTASFIELFGPPAPSHEENLAIHTHSSAVPQVERFVGSAQRVEALTEIGEYALTAALSVIVFKATTNDVSAEELDAKVNYICMSDRLLAVVHARGLCRVIVAKGMAGSIKQNGQGVSRLCRHVAARLVGHLFLTRKWDSLVETLTPIIDVAGHFPFSSYREANAKSVLQHATQALYGAIPIYEVIKQEGPDHNKTFTVLVRAGKTGLKRLGVGIGRSIKGAEKAAAMASLPMLPRVEQVVKKPRAMDDFPAWLRTRCDNVGAEVIRRVCGSELSAAFRDAVLVPPCKQLQFESNATRQRLATVGGKVRSLLAFRHAVMNRATCAEATALVNHLNKNRNLCGVVANTHLGEWIESLRRSDAFEDVDKTGPLIDTLNSLIGAVAICRGVEACRPLEAILFSGRETRSVVSARSTLQQIVQNRVHTAYNETVKYETRFLNRPEEAHRAQIEVRVFVAGELFGKGVAGNKKEATEIASQQALDDARLDDVLRRCVAPDA